VFLPVHTSGRASTASVAERQTAAFWSLCEFDEYEWAGRVWLHLADAVRTAASSKSSGSGDGSGGSAGASAAAEHEAVAIVCDPRRWHTLTHPTVRGLDRSPQRITEWLAARCHAHPCVPPPLLRSPPAGISDSAAAATAATAATAASAGASGGALPAVSQTVVEDAERVWTRLCGAYVVSPLTARVCVDDSLPPSAWLAVPICTSAAAAPATRAASTVAKAVRGLEPAVVAHAMARYRAYETAPELEARTHSDGADGETDIESDLQPVEVSAPVWSLSVSGAVSVEAAQSAAALTASAVRSLATLSLPASSGSVCFATDDRFEQKLDLLRLFLSVPAPAARPTTESKAALATQVRAVGSAGSEPELQRTCSWYATARATIVAALMSGRTPFDGTATVDAAHVRDVCAHESALRVRTVRAVLSACPQCVIVDVHASCTPAASESASDCMPLAIVTAGGSGRDPVPVVQDLHPLAVALMYDRMPEVAELVRVGASPLALVQRSVGIPPHIPAVWLCQTESCARALLAVSGRATVEQRSVLQLFASYRMRSTDLRSAHFSGFSVLHWRLYGTHRLFIVSCWLCSRGCACNLLGLLIVCVLMLMCCRVVLFVWVFVPRSVVADAQPQLCAMV
jgi:hypothetical protein